jgi:hypothetical protein
MTIDSASLLRALGSGVRPVGAEPSGQARLIEGPSFQDMLASATSGGVSSGLPIRVARSAAVDLTASQLTRLSAAADRAEAAGASRALVLIDGMVLQMDVGLRTVTGKADLNQTKVLNGVDAVVTVETEAGDLPVYTPAPMAGAMNASLLRTLAGKTPGRA